MNMKLTVKCVLLLGFGTCQANTDAQLLGNPIPFDDEFNADVDLLQNNSTDWQVLGSDVMDERASTIEINQGLLTVIPEVTHHNGWFQDDYGPLIYQEVTGNFVAAIHLRVSRGDDVDQPPAREYNAGGFVIRDASGNHDGNENWVMYNMGGQGQNGVTYAREMKKTVNSRSNLYLTEQTSMEAYLLACRVGDRFYFYYWADAISDWRQETFYNQFDVDGSETTTWRNSGDVTPEIIPAGIGQANPMYFEHETMPNTVQLGIMAHTWDNNNMGEGSRADYEFIRFGNSAPQTQNDCTASFQNLGNDLIFEHGFEGS